jgi:hypothetical protein
VITRLGWQVRPGDPRTALIAARLADHHDGEARGLGLRHQQLVGDARVSHRATVGAESDAHAFPRVTPACASTSSLRSALRAALRSSAVGLAAVPLA